MMTASRRTCAILCAFIATAADTGPCIAKPTRQQIVSLAEASKDKRERLDLIAECGADFSGLDLSGVDFRGYYAVGYETILRGADFSHCNLKGATFGASILDAADFTAADLEGTTFVTASLKDAVFHEANLTGTRFHESDLSGAMLAHADLSSADITGSNFANADLSHATLSGAKNEYWWSDFRGADLTAANMTGMQLNGAQFENAVLRSTNLSETELIQADFTDADLTAAILENANVDAADFRKARGLTSGDRSRLVREARRWKFELTTGVSSFLAAAYVPTYLSVIVMLIVLSVWAFRVPKTRALVSSAAFINVLALLPVAFLFRMQWLGAYPTVQFNAGSDTAMDMWSTWVHVWPVFMLGLLGCVTAAVITAVIFLSMHLRWRALKQVRLPLAFVVLTVVHCLFAVHWIGTNFPSA